MTNLQNSARWPEDFCGRVRLFPLPNLVLFPHVVQPLHIFEPRYCDMLADALAGDRLIAMALLQKGWEKEFQNRPALASSVCVGKIMTHTPTEDGRHNILLVGVKRGRIIREVEAETAFRMANVDILEDVYTAELSAFRPALTQKLQDLLQRFEPEGLAAQQSFKQFVGKQPPLGFLTDIISYALDLPVAVKQQLLAENNVDVRCRILTRCLEHKIKSGVDHKCGQSADDFPPRFSDN